MRSESSLAARRALDGVMCNGRAAPGVGVISEDREPVRARSRDGCSLSDGPEQFPPVAGVLLDPSRGAKLQGDYDRHGFKYVVQAAEPGAGGTITMVLVNENTVQLKPPADAPMQVWKRCAAPVG